MQNKIEIDERLKECQRGVYGIFIISRDGNCDEQCAYIGRSEQLYQRAKQHEAKIVNKTSPFPLLNSAMDDENLRLEIRLIESVEYVFDDYNKDAQRLASRENYWIDEYQKIDQCLEQVPEGKRPTIEEWKKLKELKMVIQ